jgi:hypothetical protein
MARQVYWWLAGIHTGLRSEPSDGQCLLVTLALVLDAGNPAACCDAVSMWQSALAPRQQPGNRASIIVRRK